MENEGKKLNFKRKVKEKVGILQPEITGEQAAIRGKYHNYGLKDKPFRKIVEQEAEEWNKEIRTVAAGSKLIFKPVDPFQKPLFNALKKIFEARGFNTFFLNNKVLPQLGNTDQEYLIISWDLQVDEEREYI